MPPPDADAWAHSGLGTRTRMPASPAVVGIRRQVRRLVDARPVARDGGRPVARDISTAVDGDRIGRLHDEHGIVTRVCGCGVDAAVGSRRRR